MVGKWNLYSTIFGYEATYNLLESFNAIIISFLTSRSKLNTEIDSFLSESPLPLL